MSSCIEFAGRILKLEEDGRISWVADNGTHWYCNPSIYADVLVFLLEANKLRGQYLAKQKEEKPQA